MLLETAIDIAGLTAKVMMGDFRLEKSVLIFQGNDSR